MYPFRLIAGTLWTYRAFGLILPITLLVFWVVRDRKVDPRVSSVLRSPTILEQYKMANGTAPNARMEETSPLVKQAELFAQYLHPSQVQTVTAPAIPTVKSAAPPPNFTFYTPKFALHGTCYYPSRPEESVALVWQPGGGGGTLKWLRQGARLGHFTIEEIKSGAIIYGDGEQKHEMKVEPGPAQPSLVRGHGTDAGMTYNATPVPLAAAANTESLLPEVGSEERTEQGSSGRYNPPWSSSRPP